MEQTEPFLDMPNKMYPGTWVLLGIVLAAILTAFIVMGVRWFKATYIPWKQLPGYYAGTKWHSRVSTTDPKFITEAMQAAESFLIARTKWGAANLALVGHCVRVYVMDSESWKDLYGGKVAGQQAGRNLIVGPSLAALCHELAHLCEEVIDKETDYAHATWPADGIAAAVDDFDAWLAKRGSADRVATGIVPITSAKVLRKMDACRFKERV